MRPSLLQMMKLVAASAFATAYVLPFVRLAEAGIATSQAMLTVSALGVPLVLALATIVLARKGASKDRLIRILCLISVVVALGITTHALATTARVWIQRGMPLDSRTMAPLGLCGLFVIALGLIVARILQSLTAGAVAVMGPGAQSRRSGTRKAGYQAGCETDR